MLWVRIPPGPLTPDLVDGGVGTSDPAALARPQTEEIGLKQETGNQKRKVDRNFVSGFWIFASGFPNLRGVPDAFDSTKVEDQVRFLAEML
jgi:hypothetical protein